MNSQLLHINNSVIVALVIILFASSRSFCAQSQWVYLDSHGKLAYKTLPTGDRIMDFSYAGYGGGGVAIPDVPVMITVKPGGDDAANIQKAIDDVSNLPLVDGHRGAVELSAGTFQCDKTLKITASGIVLRGSDGTILNLKGSPHLAIAVQGDKKVTEDHHSIPIIDSYIPSGSNSFEVANTSGLQVGDTIVITHPVTPAWVSFMGMNTLVRDSKDERWLSGNLETERVISNISGNRITVDVPLSDNYDARYLKPPGFTVAKAKFTGLISQVGIEHLHIECPPQKITITEKQFAGFHLDDVTDCWVRDVQLNNTVNSTGVNSGSSRVTIQRVTTSHTVATVGAAKPGDFGASGTQILFDHCSGNGDNIFYLVTMGRQQGPNVILNSEFHGNGHIEPHMRWSTGLLVDNCHVPTGGIDLMNRGIMGSGHGWTMGWGVVWNCSAKEILVQQPPGSMNWAIGCRGVESSQAMPGKSSPVLPNGIFDSRDAPVTPTSLYLEQLRERLGPQALKNIGY